MSERLRRALDIVAALGGLLVLSPLLVAVALAVRLTSRGPVLYRATRIGQGGVPFTLYKFRTMVAAADRMGPAITTQRDPRVTAVGRWLRRTKLDELPQLLNVLRGEMSLVGPRPEDPRYVALYTPEQRRILSFKPGITSAASLAYRHEEEMLAGDDWERRYREQLMPSKLATDLAYLEDRSLLDDVRLILRTIASVAR